MRIIIAPAKQMVEDTDTLAPVGKPVFMEQTEELLRFLRQLSYAGAKKRERISRRICDDNRDCIR